MIELYYWPTPNGHKVTILLEELGLPYTIVPINIFAGEQFDPEFLKISPNNRMPAIVDTVPTGSANPISIFESGAILLYLATKSGSFLPEDVQERFRVLQWLFWQVGGLGPMAGQAHHFRTYAVDKIPYSIDRYTNEVNRLYGVMERGLAGRKFLAGDYSIADMACYPWIVPHKRQGQTISEFPNVEAWFKLMSERPAVQRAYALSHKYDSEDPGVETAEQRGILFGQTASAICAASDDQRLKPQVGKDSTAR
ncbi:GST-like protein [Bradyrhizobium sp. USDA 4461]